MESTLIDSDIAKAYIVYRHERRKLRDEKMKVLNLKALDPVSKKFDLNCLRVLPQDIFSETEKVRLLSRPLKCLKESQF
ncbi:MAG: hypothetical protein OPY07_06580 [Nitrosopumilus sp.]|nr:hypothetical protein [Nitrosopumilus sp.]MDF2428899.1 hypothetical protein [Nitrosopumilus sp.]